MELRLAHTKQNKNSARGAAQLKERGRAQGGAARGWGGAEVPEPARGCARRRCSGRRVSGKLRAQDRGETHREGRRRACPE